MAGRKIPHFPIWVDDALGDLQENPISTLAVGARYRLWLIAYRRGGRLRDDDRSLAAWSGLSAAEWKRVKGEVVSGWIYEPDTGTFLIRRLAEEVERQNDLSAKAKSAAEARWKKDGCERNAPAMQPHPDMLSTRNASPPPPPPPPNPIPPKLSEEILSSPDGATASDPHSPDSSARSRSPAQEGTRAGPEPRVSGERPARPDPGGGHGRRRPGGARAGPPANARRGTGPPGLTDEQGDRLDHLRRRILASRDLQRHAPAIDRVVLAQLRRGAPATAIEQGLVSLLDHQPRDPAAYLAKVLRVEVPNHHEAAAIAGSREANMSPEEARKGLTRIGAVLASGLRMEGR